MDGLGIYQQIVFDTFSAEARKVEAGVLFFDEWDRNDHSTLPYLAEALEAVGPDCQYPDDAVAALNRLANDLQGKAEANRGAPEWKQLCISMGWARSAAVRVWDVPSAAASRSV